MARGKKMESTLVVQEPGTIAQGSVLDYSHLKNAKLIEATRDLEVYAGQGAAMAKQYSYHIAIALYNIHHTELFKTDGFKNVVDYANAVKLIGDTRSKQAIYQAVFAGEVYSDKTIPESIRNMTVSNLNILKAALSDKEKRERIIEDAKNGKNFATMNQKELAKYRDELNGKGDNENAEFVETYTVIHAKPIEDVITILKGISEKSVSEVFKTLDEHENYVKNNHTYTEFLKLKALKITLPNGNDKVSIERRIGIKSGINTELLFYVPHTMYLAYKARTEAPDTVVTSDVESNRLSEVAINRVYKNLIAGDSDYTESEIAEYLSKEHQDRVVQMYSKILDLYPAYIGTINASIRNRPGLMELVSKHLKLETERLGAEYAAKAAANAEYGKKAAVEVETADNAVEVTANDKAETAESNS